MGQLLTVNVRLNERSTHVYTSFVCKEDDRPLIKQNNLIEVYHNNNN